MQKFFSQQQLQKTIVKNASKAAVAIVCGVGILTVLVIKINAVVKDIQNQREKIFITQEEIERSAVLSTEIELLGQRDTKIQNTMLSANNIIPFVNYIEKIAVRHNLLYQEDFSIPVVLDLDLEQPLARIDFTINLSGDVDSLLAYIKEFDTLPYLASITNIRMSTPSTNGLKDSGSFILQGELYVTK